MTTSRKPPSPTTDARTQPIIKPKVAEPVTLLTDVPPAPTQKATRQPRIKPK